MESKILHSDLYNQIVSTLKKSENIQLTGLKGLGKSRLMRDMEDSQPEGLSIYRSDLGLISDRSIYSILKFIFGGILGLEKTRNIGPGELSSEIKEYFREVKASGRKVVLLLDSFDKLRPEPDVLNVFNFLSSLHSQSPGSLGFVFGVEKPLIHDGKNDYGDFGKLLFGKVIYITPLNEAESQAFIDIQAKESPDLKLTSEEKNKIVEVSGGYMFVIKRLIQGLSAGEKLDNLVTNPGEFPALAYGCELLVGQLGLDKELFKKYYVIDDNNNFICKVFENYLKNKPDKVKTSREDSLTASEYKILEFLKENKGGIVGREDIIKAVWGESANNGISDHALDQIVSRLRKKLSGSSDLKIETIRGRGHRLI